ncbi:hypothetical protein GDO81_020795 [Engystomops pustulosus]|uniref:Uncharacterized protein n=1 Tax=Engystomops pustulosus TaxID=76066 RepID=A0AAV6ZGX9_ENGPU|nr:hypothetical protein GDO81_020795 [Engystomops pustulosus]
MEGPGGCYAGEIVTVSIPGPHYPDPPKPAACPMGEYHTQTYHVAELKIWSSVSAMDNQRQTLQMFDQGPQEEAEERLQIHSNK